MTTREEVWLRALVAYPFNEVESVRVRFEFADCALAEFDKRFPQAPASAEVGPSFCDCGSNFVNRVPGGFQCKRCGTFIPVKGMEASGKVAPEGAD